MLRAKEKNTNEKRKSERVVNARNRCSLSRSLGTGMVKKNREQNDYRRVDVANKTNKRPPPPPDPRQIYGARLISGQITRLTATDRRTIVCHVYRARLMRESVSVCTLRTPETVARDSQKCSRHPATREKRKVQSANNNARLP